MSPAERLSSDRVGGDDRSPWAVLHRLLVRTLGDANRAAAVLTAALSRRTGEEPPVSRAQVLAFAQEQLAPPLERAIGPRLLAAFLAALELELASRPVSGPAPAPTTPERRAASAPPPRAPRERGAARPLALVVAADALERASLARALVVEGFDVRTSVESLLGALPRIVVVGVDPAGQVHEDGAALRELLASSALAVVVRASNASALGERAVARAFGSDASPRTIAVAASELAAAADGTSHVSVPPDATLEAGERVSFERVAPDALRRVPSLAVERDEVGWFEGAPEHAAFLGLVDGARDLRTIAAACNLSPVVVVNVALALVAQGLIVIDE